MQIHGFSGKDLTEDQMNTASVMQATYQHSLIDLSLRGIEHLMRITSGKQVVDGFTAERDAMTLSYVSALKSIGITLSDESNIENLNPAEQKEKPSGS